VKNNGFNPVWEETLSLPFEVVGDMRELVFVRFVVREDGDDESEALAVHCVSLACLREGTYDKLEDCNCSCGVPRLRGSRVDGLIVDSTFLLLLFRVPPLAPV
jgi:hypothetical protein